MSLVAWKEIKPAALKVKAMQKELLKEIAKTGKDIKADFEKTTSTWNTKISFDILSDLNPDGPQILVGTDNVIYKFVDKGTRPHIIRPKHAKALRFHSGYNAKTTPNVIGSKSGGPFGDIVYSLGVKHPGTEGRNFSQILQKKWQTVFKRRMEKAMKRARKASGHAI